MREKDVDELIEEFRRLHLAQAKVLDKITEARKKEKSKTHKILQDAPQETACVPLETRSKPGLKLAGILGKKFKPTWYH